MIRKHVRAGSAAALAIGLSGCWAQSRYDAAQSNWNRDETIVTPANVAELEELWSQDLGDGRLLSPLSMNGTIYAVSDAYKATTGYAFDAKTGAERWQRTTPDELGSDVNLSDPVWFNSQIVVPWGYLKVGGTRLLDPATGAEVASTADNAIWGVMVAGGRTATGSSTYGSVPPPNTPWWNGIAWRCSAGVGGVGGSPGGGFDMAFVGDSLMWADVNRALGYVGCPAGATTWASTWNVDLGGRPVAIVGIGTTHVAYLDDTGTLTVLDAATGTTTWTDEVGSGAAPAIADGKLILRIPGGRVAARDALTGETVWESAAVAATGAPVVGGGVVYVPAGHGIVAFALDGCASPTCDPLATVDAGSPVATTIVDDGRLIATTTDNRIVVFGLL